MKFAATLIALFSATPLCAQSAALSPYLSQASCTNSTTAPGACTFSIWNYGDGWNQTELASFTGDAQPGQTVPLSMRLDLDSCTPTMLQLDVWWNLPNPRERHTISDTLNARLLASKVVTVPATKACAPPPPEPPPPPVEPQCVSRTFTFGGSPTIARFPDGFANPWFPESVGPFYFSAPVDVYRITAVTGDNHVGPGGKNDGTQAHEIGSFVFDNGWVLGPTNDVPDDVNSVVTDFGVRGLISPLHSFYFVHAGPTNPAVPTDSVFPITLTFTCP